MTEALQKFIDAIPHGTDNDGCEFWNPEPVLRAFVKEVERRVQDSKDRDMYGVGWSTETCFHEFVRELGLEDKS